MRLPVSVTMITKNEECRIADAIEAVLPWAGEIIVVDSGSTDRTCEIARALGAKVHHRDWTGYGPQKRYAETLCNNWWILNVDADEIVTPELASEIQWLFSHGEPSPASYKVRILTVYAGDDWPRPFANDYNVIRLYHRSIGSFRDHPVFDRIDIGKHRANQLKNPIYHHCHLSIDHAIEKALRFSAFRAETSQPRSHAVLCLRLIIEAPLTFLKFYIGRRHITGGWKGFYFSAIHAFMRLTRIARMLEASQ